MKIFLLLTLFFCHRALPHGTKMSITKEEMALILPKTEAKPYFTDDSYCSITKQKLWVINKKLLFSYKQKKISVGLTNDCDDYSRGLCNAAQLTHRDPTKGQAYAVGDFHYVTRDNKKHAIVIALTAEGWIFIEPQTAEEVYLTDQEVKSCFFLRF